MLFCIFACVAGALPVCAKDGTAGAQFDKAYKALLAADDARDSSRSADAAKLYQQAFEQYMDLSKRYPSWQPGVVKFRIAYCNNQLESVMKATDKSPPAQAQIPSEKADVGDAVSPESGRGKTEIPSESVDAQNAGRIDDLLVRAKSLLAAGKSEDARALLIDGMHLQPDNRTIRLLIGIAQCQSGMFTDAVYLLAELTREDPSNPVTHVALGSACFGLGRFDDAVKEMNRALELNPKLVEAHYNMAQILKTMNPPDMDGAREHYRKALDLGGKRDKDLDALLKKTDSASPAKAPGKN